MPTSIQFNAAEIDFNGRVTHSETVVASPAAAAETIIASVSIPNNTPIVAGVLLFGWAAYTVGTNGTAVTFKLRQTNVAGATIASTGALTGSQHGAAILSDDNISGFDSAAGASQLYVMTMQVTAGSAASTVSAVELCAVVL
jgi:hypothetical protein